MTNQKKSRPKTSLGLYFWPKMGSAFRTQKKEPLLHALVWPAPKTGTEYAPKNGTLKVHNLTRHVGQIATTNLSVKTRPAAHQAQLAKDASFMARRNAPFKENFWHVFNMIKKRLP